MEKKTIDKKTFREFVMFYFLLGLAERPGLCQGCEILKQFLDEPKYKTVGSSSIISFWGNLKNKYIPRLKPLFRLGKHELPCMAFNIGSFHYFKKIVRDLDDAVKAYDELKNKIDSNTDEDINKLKNYLADSTQLRKQVLDTFLRLINSQCRCKRLTERFGNISKVFELPPCPSEVKSQNEKNAVQSLSEAEHPNISSNWSLPPACIENLAIGDNPKEQNIKRWLNEYNYQSKAMISLQQEYLQLLCLGQKSKLILDKYGYRPQRSFNEIKWESPYPSPQKLEVRMFLWPQNMEDKESGQLKDTIFNALFEIPNIAGSLPKNTSMLRSMLSDNYLTIYKPVENNTDGFPDFLKTYPVINLFCVEEKLLTQKLLRENNGRNNLKINLKDNNSCLLVVHGVSKKNKKWLEKWKEQGKLKHYLKLTKTDDENLFSRISDLIKYEKLNDGSCPPYIPGITSLFDEERYKSLHYITILLEMARHIYFGEDKNSESKSALLNLIAKYDLKLKNQEIAKILSFKPVVETLINRSLNKIKFEDVPKHFLQPTMARTGKRLATSWFVGGDGHNTRNAAVLMALGKAVVNFIQKGTITEETCIIKEIRNIDDRLRRLEDKILQINLSDEMETGKKHQRNISYEDRKKIPDEDLRKALLGGVKNKRT